MFEMFGIHEPNGTRITTCPYIAIYTGVAHTMDGHKYYHYFINANLNTMLLTHIRRNV